MVINRLLVALNKKFRNFLGDGLYFQRKADLVIESQGQEDVTINGYRTKATPWFDNICLNIKIVLKYCDNHNDVEPYVSVVFFKKVDSNLQPLFRGGVLEPVEKRDLDREDHRRQHVDADACRPARRTDAASDDGAGGRAPEPEPVYGQQRLFVAGAGAGL